MKKKPAQHRNTGTKLWHRWVEETQSYICRRQPAGAIPPANSGWEPGFAPKDPDIKAAEDKKRSEAMKGRVMTDSWKEKMSKASKGKPKSEAHKKAMSEAQNKRQAKLKELEAIVEQQRTELLLAQIRLRRVKESDESS
jgi:hypothetical protein